MKSYIFIASLGLLIAALITVAIFDSGNPLVKKGYAIDRKRLDDFGGIRVSVNFYYKKNGKIPQSLNEIESSGSLIDQETKKPYEYKKLTDTTYQLCTTFNTDSGEFWEKTNGGPPEGGETFKKGYSCTDQKVIDYIVEEYKKKINGELDDENTIKLDVQENIIHLRPNKQFISRYNSTVFITHAYLSSKIDDPNAVRGKNNLVLEYRVENTEEVDEFLYGDDFFKIKNGETYVDSIGGLIPNGERGAKTTVRELFLVEPSRNIFEFQFEGSEDPKSFTLDFTNAEIDSGNLTIQFGLRTSD